MKNLIMRMRKQEGFVSIETVLVAAIVVAIGILSFNAVFAGTLAGKATDANTAIVNSDIDELAPYVPTLP